MIFELIETANWLNFSNFFGLEKLDKAPREVFSPEIQKVSGQSGD